MKLPAHRITQDDIDGLLAGLDSEARTLRLVGPAILGRRVIVEDAGLYELGSVPWSLAVTGSADTPGGPAAHLLED